MYTRPKKKASVRDSYKADPEKKKASVRDCYNADIESKQSAKRQRYQEDLEKNRAAKRQKYKDNSAAIKASERNRYWNDPAFRLAKRAAERTRYRKGHRTTTTTCTQSYMYSLYEPKSHALMEYNGGLEKAILRDSELLSEVNDAFCKSHPLLAQKVVTRSARAAVSKIGADALVSKALSERRAKAWSLLKTIREVNALKLEENYIVGHGYHTAGSLPPWPLDAVLPPYHPPPAAAAELPPPPPAAELPPSPPAAAGAPYLHQPHHRHQYWHQCPHHHFTCCHPGHCHHHPHGSHGRNQATKIRDEAGGEEDDKAGKPYSTLKTNI
ncbi:hypothetical protein EMCRGX_G023256 [Ephydatia muelleri]